MRGTLEERFWAKVDKNGPVPMHCPGLGPCWIWTGCRSSAGYGQLRVNHKAIYAHRISWEIHHGSIDDSLFVLHRCDNPTCVRPDHLLQGTASDNSADMSRKGRSGPANHPERLPRGEDQHLSKLTEEQIREIRNQPDAEHRRLGKQYGVAHSTIGRILRRETWSWLQ